MAKSHRITTLLATLFWIGVFALPAASISYGKSPGILGSLKRLIIGESDPRDRTTVDNRERTVDEVCNDVKKEQNPVLYERCRQRVQVKLDQTQPARQKAPSKPAEQEARQPREQPVESEAIQAKDTLVREQDRTIREQGAKLAAKDAQLQDAEAKNAKLEQRNKDQAKQIQDLQDKLDRKNADVAKTPPAPQREASKPQEQAARQTPTKEAKATAAAKKSPAPPKQGAGTKPKPQATPGNKVVKQPPKPQRNTAGKTTTQKKTPKMTAKQQTSTAVLLDLVDTFEKADVGVVRALLSDGADVNAREKYSLGRDSLGRTVLMLAARHQSPEVVKVLLAAGADVNARGSGGKTALMYAAESNENSEMVKVLLGAGADVNARDIFGNTELMHAASFTKHPEVLRILLAHGADVNAQKAVGGTALLFAADRHTEEGDKQAGMYTGAPPEDVILEMVEVLLAAGADVDARDGYGRTALYYAEGFGKPKVAEVLRAAKDRAPVLRVGMIPTDMVKRCTGSGTLSELREQAEQGCVEAQETLGQWYELGLGGVSRDRKTALEWYGKAAAQGSAGARAGLKRLGR